MVSLRTMLLWVAVVALGVVSLFLLLFVAGTIQGGADLPYLWPPLFVTSLVALAIAVYAVQRSSEQDRRELPMYENRVVNSIKPVFLAVAAVGFGFLAILALLALPGSLESESCSYFGGGDAPTFERCTDGREYWRLAYWIPFFLLPLLTAISSAAVLWRDCVSNVARREAR